MARALAFWLRSVLVLVVIIVVVIVVVVVVVVGRSRTRSRGHGRTTSGRVRSAGGASARPMSPRPPAAW